jgi:hypothetical protein
MQVTASSKKNEFFAISLYLQNLTGFSFTTTGLKMQFSSPFGLVPHPPILQLFHIPYPGLAGTKQEFG